MEYRITQALTISDKDFDFEISPIGGRAWTWVNMSRIFDLISSLKASIAAEYWRRLMLGETVVVRYRLIRCKPVPVISTTMDVDEFRAEILREIPLTRLQRVREAKGHPNQITRLIAALKDHMRVMDPDWEDPEIIILTRRIEASFDKVLAEQRKTLQVIERWRSRHAGEF